jgi:hypothetical protein
VFRKDVRIPAVSEALEERRGPFDVGEEKGDRPSWEAGHALGLRTLSIEAAYPGRFVGAHPGSW